MSQGAAFSADNPAGWADAALLKRKVNNMKNFLFALSLGLGGVIWATQNVAAQTMSCAERELVIERLQTKYGETRQSMGLGNNNGIVEVFASDETGTWTILVTLPNGMSCLIASGQSWEQIAEDVLVPGNDA